MICRRLIELVLLILMALIPMYGSNANIIISEYIIFIILFIMPFMILIESITPTTEGFYPIVRASFSLFCHIVALGLGSFLLYFFGALTQKYASNEIIPKAAEAFLDILPYVIGLWLLDEALRFFLREPSSVIQWKFKNKGF